MATLVGICFGILIACGIVLFAIEVASPAWSLVRRFASVTRIQQVVLAVCVCGLIHYGATKNVSYDGGIKAGTNSNVISNSTVSIWWQRDTSGGVYVPDSASVYIDYRLSSDTNGTWTLLAQSTVGAGHLQTVVQNATNYDYNVWAYYIPPEPVHTNGVWIYKTMRDRADKNPLPIRARIEVNGKAIATPKEKRKDEE